MLAYKTKLNTVPNIWWVANLYKTLLLLAFLVMGYSFGQNWGTSVGIGLTDNMNVLESKFLYKLNENIIIFSAFGLPTQMLGVNYQQNNSNENGYSIGLGYASIFGSNGYAGSGSKISFLYQIYIGDVGEPYYNKKGNIFMASMVLKTGINILFDGLSESIYPFPIISFSINGYHLSK